MHILVFVSILLINIHRTDRMGDAPIMPMLQKCDSVILASDPRHNIVYMVTSDPMTLT